MDKREVLFMGVRTNTWKDRVSQEQKTRHVADLYMPGVGGYDKVLTPEQFGRLANVAPGTKMVQALDIEISNEVVKGGEGKNDWARRTPSVRFGDLELSSVKAS